MKYYTHPTYYKMLELIFSSFPGESKIRVLDYGCGSGYLLSILPKSRIKRYVGYDVSSKAVENAKRLASFKRASFKIIDLEKRLDLGEANSQDVVIAIGVLQYLTEQQIDAFINEAKRVLKKGGVLIITTVVDHIIYKILNIYGLFLPNRFVNRDKLIGKLTKVGLNVDYQKESGLIIGPLVSHNLAILPDILDKIIFSTKGTLGLFGLTFRKICTPIMLLESFIPIDYGYTLYIRARKK